MRGWTCSLQRLGVWTLVVITPIPPERFGTGRPSEGHLENPALRSHQPSGLRARESHGPVVLHSLQPRPAVPVVGRPRRAPGTGGDDGSTPPARHVCKAVDRA